MDSCTMAFVSSNEQLRSAWHGSFADSMPKIRHEAMTKFPFYDPYPFRPRSYTPHASNRQPEELPLEKSSTAAQLKEDVTFLDEVFSRMSASFSPCPVSSDSTNARRIQPEILSSARFKVPAKPGPKRRLKRMPTSYKRRPTKKEEPAQEPDESPLNKFHEAAQRMMYYGMVGAEIEAILGRMLDVKANCVVWWVQWKMPAVSGTSADFDEVWNGSLIISKSGIRTRKSIVLDRFLKSHAPYWQLIIDYETKLATRLEKPIWVGYVDGVGKPDSVEDFRVCDSDDDGHEERSESGASRECSTDGTRDSVAHSTEPPVLRCWTPEDDISVIECDFDPFSDTDSASWTDTPVKNPVDPGCYSSTQLALWESRLAVRDGFLADRECLEDHVDTLGLLADYLK